MEVSLKTQLMMGDHVVSDAMRGSTFIPLLSSLTTLGIR